MSEFTPKTRLEKFLAKIAGRSEEELEPKTRLEAALDDIAENIGQGSGSSGGSGNIAVFEEDAKGVEFNGEHFDIINFTTNGENNFLPISGWYDDDDVPNGAVLCVTGNPMEGKGRVTGMAGLQLVSCDPIDPTKVAIVELALLSKANIMVIMSNILEEPIAFIPRNAMYAKGSSPK